MMSESLPYDAEIEYLESTGTQYIDTGIVVDSANGFVGTTIDFQLIAFDQNNVVPVAGAVMSSGNFKYTNLQVTVSNTTHDKGFSTWGGFVFSQEDMYERTVATANGVGNAIPNNNFLLFARNRNTLGVQTLGSCRIYSSSIYKNNTLVCDFIPVRVGQVGYMYDKVSGQLFGNQGTGNFTLGPDK